MDVAGSFTAGARWEGKIIVPVIMPLFREVGCGVAWAGAVVKIM